MYFDTHSHLNLKEFEKDRFSVAEECLKKGVQMINVGTGFFDSKIAVEIAERYPKGVYASVGLHPLYVEEEDFDIERFRELAKKDKVLSIGETGLDYFYSPKKLSIEDYRELQKYVFIKQLDLAEELKKPVIIHIRDAFEDAYKILKERQVRAVIHCFTGSLDDLEKFLSLGCYIGINGIIFKADLDEVVKKIPEDKILFETDCPYLSPPNFKGKRNDPMGVIEVAKAVNELRGKDLTEQAFNNSLKFFNYGI